VATKAGLTIFSLLTRIFPLILYWILEYVGHNKMQAFIGSNLQMMASVKFNLYFMFDFNQLKFNIEPDVKKE
jgi:hypothetical protein